MILLRGFIPPFFTTIKSNIIVVSNRANILKKDATLDELVMIGKFYGELRGKQN